MNQSIIQLRQIGGGAIQPKLSMHRQGSSEAWKQRDLNLNLILILSIQCLLGMEAEANKE